MRVILNVVVHTLHTLFETAQTFTQTLAEFRQLAATKENEQDNTDDKQMGRLKQIIEHEVYLRVRARRNHPRSNMIVARIMLSLSGAFLRCVPVTYTEKYEIFGAANFLNGQAGQSLPKRYDLGGGEVMATYWITPKYGVAGDFRYDIGSTPVLPAGQATNPQIQTRPYASQAIGMGGVQYHFRGNHYAGINFHALAGITHGTFDHSNPGLPVATFTAATGLYSNRTSFMGTIGPSIDFNRSAHFAVRLSPEIVFEHFGTEVREFVSVSGGIVYRFGER